MATPFTLDPGAVAQTQQMLTTTGETVRDQAEIARGAVTDLSGSGWDGPASVVAINKQNDEFSGAVGKLFNEINRISEALGLGRVDIENTDEDNVAALQGIPVELGNFGRI